MPLVLVKETGTGSATANSYASAADGDAYFLGHLYTATDWTVATTATKEAALVMASRLIDSSYQFKGWRAVDLQALQWPRVYAKDPDRLNSPYPVRLTIFGQYFDNLSVPTPVVNATIETARTLIIADRTTDPDGEGLKQLSLTGVLALTFDAADRRPMIPHLAQLMLVKLGQLLHEKVGVARLIRA